MTITAMMCHLNMCVAPVAGHWLVQDITDVARSYRCDPTTLKA